MPGIALPSGLDRANRLAIRFLQICAMWLGLTGLALACAAPEDMRTDTPPGGLGTQTEVITSFAVVDFMGVDDGNQRIEVDFFMQMVWTDPRLIEQEGCRLSITEVWLPRINLLNSHNLRVAYRNARNQVAIGADGIVSYTQRFTGPVSSYHNLSDFPFDAHTFGIDFVAVRDANNLIDFVADHENSWIGERLNIEGWDVDGIGLLVTPHTFRGTDLDVEKLTLQIWAERNPEFYIYRVICLLAMVVAMSWAIFWVPPSRFEFQIGLGATTMLTTMAFIFAIGSQLPPVGYLTTLDKMVIWANMLVFMSIVEALIAGRMVLNGREEQALRLDRASRFCFPVLLLTGWAIVISV